MFLLAYPVFHVEFICKDCVCERERVCEDSRQLKTEVAFTGISQVSFTLNEACVLHITGMRRVRTNGDSCVSRVARG